MVTIETAVHRNLNKADLFTGHRTASNNEIPYTVLLKPPRHVKFETI